MNANITKATSEDLPFLKLLEKTCFPEFQRSDNRSLKRSISSSLQDVYVAKILIKGNITNSGSVIFYLYKNTLRLFSVAVLPEYRKLHIGEQLMEFCINYAQKNHFQTISLEVLSSADKLINWYENKGFVKKNVLKDYYDDGGDGVKMTLKLQNNQT